MTHLAGGGGRSGYFGAYIALQSKPTLKLMSAFSASKPSIWWILHPVTKKRKLFIFAISIQKLAYS